MLLKEHPDHTTDRQVWHEWFAWYPVTLTNGRSAWLETVLRKFPKLPWGDTTYKRLPENEEQETS